MVSLVDTHCHLNFDAYKDDLDAILTRAREAKVERVIIPAVDLTTIDDALTIAHAHEGIYVAVGVHPNSTSHLTGDWVGRIASYIDDTKVVAIGEIGLDYYWDKSPPNVQKEAFQAQLDLAKQHSLPIIIHNREASDDVMAILELYSASLSEAQRERIGVLHSFSAPQSIAKRALEAGFYLGFTGPITFKKADDLRAVLGTVPVERLLVETDGPFLTPHPYRGKRNEPSYIPYIVDRMASVKQLATDEMGRITTENAERLFGI